MEDIINEFRSEKNATPADFFSQFHVGFYPEIHAGIFLEISS